MTFPIMLSTELENKHNPWLTSQICSCSMGTEPPETIRSHHNITKYRQAQPRSSHEEYRVELMTNLVAEFSRLGCLKYEKNC